jgi:phosphoglycolate phosphatase
MNVFLDLDGPILDNREKYYRLYRDLLWETPCRPLPMSAYWSYKRDRIPEREILDRSSVPRSLHQDYLEARSRLIESVDYLSLDRVWPGVHPWLEKCSTTNTTYLVTMRKHRRTLLTQLERLKILPLLHDVLSVDNNGGDWQVKHRLMKSCWSAAEPSVIVGDTEADIQAGQHLEIPTVAVRSGIRNDSHLAALRPSLIVDSLIDVDLNELMYAHQR